MNVPLSHTSGYSRRVSPPADQRSKIEIIFASKGRPDLLARAVENVALQTIRPASIILSCSDPSDFGSIADRPNVKVAVGPAGLPRQRNAGLGLLDPDTEVVVFFDDDFVPHSRWLECVETEFRADPMTVAISGYLLRDGINGPGLTVEHADELLRTFDPEAENWREADFSPNGCDMAFRRSAIRDNIFDERLVLYGWLEDRDFGGALRRQGGRSIRLGSAGGVHLGTKSGRVAGRKLGYSQIVNPLYLKRKGTMTSASVVDHVGRNFLSNLVRSLTPEPYVDRRGRLSGNLIGMWETVCGTARPERAEEL